MTSRALRPKLTALRLRDLDLDRLNRRWGPWFSLASGIGTLALIRRGASFAPVAAAFLVVAWTGTAALTRFLAPREGEPRWRSLLRTVAGRVTAGLYQDCLFFLLPIWFASATWPSTNGLFPVFLAAMALLSCFEHAHRALVVERPFIGAAWHALVLFALLVPAITVLAKATLGPALMLAAASASLAAGLALAPRMDARRRLLAILGGAAISALLAWFGASLLPPVPLVRMERGAGTKIEGRRLLGAAEQFPSSVERVYAWFAIAGPAGYRHAVRFEWSRDGVAHGAPFETEVVGGREAGFRTWAYVTRPAPGRWRAELRTVSGQILGRVAFTVGP